MSDIYRVFDIYSPRETLGLFEYGWSPAGSFAIEALSDYAQREGFARYDEMEPVDRAEFVSDDEPRLACAVFCNTEIAAVLVGHRRRLCAT